LKTFGNTVGGMSDLLKLPAMLWIIVGILLIVFSLIPIVLLVVGILSLIVGIVIFFTKEQKTKMW
jgi:hypothetical protein